jgi:hypothetical protein
LSVRENLLRLMTISVAGLHERVGPWALGIPGSHLLLGSN